MGAFKQTSSVSDNEFEYKHSENVRLIITKHIKLI